MNPWKPCDDLYFQISSSSADYSSLPIIQTSPSAAEDYHHQILVHGYEYDPAVVDASASVPPCPNQKGKGKGKQRKELTPNNNALGAEDGDENKKWMHREIEKQRRQEMSRLCTTFRTLLPFEYIKGKRSTSDHMHEGVKYIKHLQNRVEKLQAKRDELVKLINLRPKSGSSSSSSTQHVHHHHHQTFVIVEPFSGGVLIKCSYSFRNYAFPLSGILDIVLRQGLNVVDCSSITTDDHRFIHTIRSEDSQVMTTETDYTELQRKLKEAISSSSN
ncbi:transcription factor bHLH36-like [Arachis stenosperma]|uniref:transcription factor bHLH36-like n=1 Tax=Arachis stenosperma TaxID=217475 RepID=UPI0025ACF1FA|nr:transcription factor bHLH36-like [Arachis stenosperma]